jgi:hypothetical protein
VTKAQILQRGLALGVDYSLTHIPAHRELGDVGYHPAAPSHVHPREERTRGALLSSDEFRVEGRANGDASSVMTVHGW